MGRGGWLPALAVAGAVTLGVAGCTTVPGQTLDRASVQHTIAIWLAARYDVPAPAVSCPSRVPGRTGTHFDCTTALAGAPITVDGTVADSSGRFTITLDKAVIDAAKAGRLLAGQLGAPGRTPPAVDCGPGRVRVMAPGGTFTCTATQGGVTQTVTGTASDTQGDVSFSVLVPVTPSTSTGTNAAAPAGSPVTTTPVTAHPTGPATPPSTTPTSAPPTSTAPTTTPPSTVPATTTTTTAPSAPTTVPATPPSTAATPATTTQSGTTGPNTTAGSDTTPGSNPTADPSTPAG